MGPHFFMFMCFFWALRVGRHVSRTKPPPKKLLSRYENGLKNAPQKRIRNKIGNVSEKFKAPLSGSHADQKISHQHFSKSLSPPKICTKKGVLSPRGSAGVARLNKWNLGTQTIRLAEAQLVRQRAWWKHALLSSKAL